MTWDPTLSSLQDPKRLAALNATGLLSAESVPSLDRLTRLAARVLHVPVAQINLVTADQQIPISYVGGPGWGGAVGLDRSFCKYSVASGEPMAIDDARVDPRVQDSLATLEGGVVAYASTPITPDGATAPLCTLCVVDFEPRHWAAEELQILEDIAASVRSEIELRDARHRAEERADAANRALLVQRDRLQTIFEQAPAAITVTRGPDHVAEIVNPRYGRLIGGREILGKPAREALPELNEQGFFELLDRVYATGEPFVGNEVPATYDRDDDGRLQTAYFDFVYQPLTGADGTVDGIMVHAVEVTEQARARNALQEQATELEAQAEELREQATQLEEIQAELELSNLELVERGEEAEAARERLQLVVDHIPIGVVLAEAPDGRIVFGNRRVEEIMRHPVLPSPSADAYGEWVGFHADGRRVQAREWPLARTLAGEVVPGEDYLYQRGDGTRVWIRISGAPIRDAAGHITGGIVTIADVERERSAQDEVQRTTALLTSVMNAAREPIFAKDREGRYLAANNAVLRNFGRPAEQVLGRTDAELLPPDIANAIRAADREAMTAGEPRVYEERVPLEGDFRLYATSKGPLRDPDGEVVGVVGVARDVTEQKRIEGEREQLLRQIQSERALLQQVFDNAPAVMALYSGPEHIVTLVNPTWERTVGKPNAVGKPFREVFPEFEESGLFERLDRVYQTGKRFSDPEINVPIERWESGEMEDTYWDLVWLPLPERDGEPRETLVHAIEVTEQVRARRAVEEADRTKSDFLATMSHELRTPLNAMLGYADLLRLGVPEPIGDAARRQVERIALSARHLLQIIEEILTFSRLEAGREETDLAEVSLDEIAQEVNAIIEPLAESKQLRFRVDVSSAPERITTDPRKLRQILVNLLGNAVKFTDRGEIELVAEARDGGLAIRVRDTGIGIDPKHRDQLFDAFWQVDTSSRRTAEGTGLGLTVSRRLARLLGGELTVESTPGEGSTFTVQLPLRSAPGSHPA